MINSDICENAADSYGFSKKRTQKLCYSLKNLHITVQTCFFLYFPFSNAWNPKNVYLKIIKKCHLNNCDGSVCLKCMHLDALHMNTSKHQVICAIQWRIADLRTQNDIICGEYIRVSDLYLEHKFIYDYYCIYCELDYVNESSHFRINCACTVHSFLDYKGIFITIVSRTIYVGSCSSILHCTYYHWFHVLNQV